MKKKEEITTMMDSDFEKLLIQTNQLDDFNNGEIQCCKCNRKITIDNIGVILPSDNEGKIELAFICNDPECITSI